MSHLGPVAPLSGDEVRHAVLAALKEDVGSGDVTTRATIPAEAQARALLRAREPLVLAGIEFAECAFQSLSPEIRLRRLCQDGTHVAQGGTMLEISGAARAILTGERVALNFVQRLSGVATLTARFVEAVAGTGARILDTRKTTPGWRLFEKYAVRQGGGTNHRFGLYDMVLIKDNHLVALRNAKPNSIAAAVQSARQTHPDLKVEVEADTLEQVRQAVEAGANYVLLDNMSQVMLCEAVSICRGRIQIEASGGVTLDTIRGIAETGVDFISVGALTHSARAVDLGLDFEP